MSADRGPGRDSPDHRTETVGEVRYLTGGGVQDWWCMPGRHDVRAVLAIEAAQHGALHVCLKCWLGLNPVSVAP